MVACNHISFYCIFVLLYLLVYYFAIKYNGIKISMVLFGHVYRYNSIICIFVYRSYLKTNKTASDLDEAATIYFTARNTTTGNYVQILLFLIISIMCVYICAYSSLKLLNMIVSTFIMVFQLFSNTCIFKLLFTFFLII